MDISNLLNGAVAGANRKAFEKCADDLFGVYSAFCGAGFTNAQAMALVQAFWVNAILKGKPKAGGAKREENDGKNTE